MQYPITLITGPTTMVVDFNSSLFSTIEQHCLDGFNRIIIQFQPKSTTNNTMIPTTPLKLIRTMAKIRPVSTTHSKPPTLPPRTPELMSPNTPEYDYVDNNFLINEV